MKPIKCVVFDLDGVFTNGKIYISTDGSHSKSYDCKDTYALKMLLREGIRTAMITAGDHRVLEQMIHVRPRIQHLVCDVHDKITQLKKWQQEFGLEWEEIAYIGDDISDLAPIQQVGFSGCPSNAIPELLESADFVCQKAGGNGAVREFVEEILRRNREITETLSRVQASLPRTGEITAVIPVRAGSQRVKKKNIRPFAGSNLLRLKIEMLKSVTGIDQIVVSSDSEEMLEIARELGVRAHLREPYYASSGCPNHAFWTHLAEKVVQTPYFMLANCVAPLIQRESYEEMIRIFRTTAEFDSLATVEERKDFIWDNQKKVALNYDGSKAPNSQNLPDWVSLTFGVCLLPTSQVIKNHTVIGEHPYLYKLNQVEAMDIDTETDFEVAEIMYERYLASS